MWCRQFPVSLFGMWYLVYLVSFFKKIFVYSAAPGLSCGRWAP